ncbi:MAG: 16S rRNA methyltransferase [Nitrososphaerota archaeon]
MKILHLIIAEAALELVPEEIQSHPAVRHHASRLGKAPREILLDRSYHHWAMGRLRDSMKRGRPDIIHLTLLEILGSPLNLAGKLKVWISTYDDRVIELVAHVRLPRVYERFKGLVEKLYAAGEVTTSEGERIMAVRSMPLKTLIKEISPDITLLLSEKGQYASIDDLGMDIAASARPAVIIGGFPHLSFKRETLELADKIVSIYPRPLEAWIVASRLLCALERHVKGDIGAETML